MQNSKTRISDGSNESSDSSTPEYNFKIVVIGDSRVGKTTLIKYVISNQITENLEPTAIFSHFFKNYNINGKTIGLQIWDTSGEEAYRCLLQRFFRLSLCIFIVFSLENENSFNNLPLWLEEIKNNNEINYNDSIKILIGTKNNEIINMENKEENIQKFCKENEIDEYCEVNLKTGENIKELFTKTALKLYNKFVVITLDQRENEEYVDSITGIKNSCLNKKPYSSLCKSCLCYNQ